METAGVPFLAGALLETGIGTKLPMEGFLEGLITGDVTRRTKFEMETEVATRKGPGLDVATELALGEARTEVVDSRKVVS